MVDMMICTLTVTVTPAATAPTIKRKKTAPMSVVRALPGVAEVKMLITLPPAGNVAMTMNKRADTTNAHPER